MDDGILFFIDVEIIRSLNTFFEISNIFILEIIEMFDYFPFNCPEQPKNRKI